LNLCKAGVPTRDVVYNFIVQLLWTPAQHSLSVVHVIFCQFIFFMAALFSGPG